MILIIFLTFFLFFISFLQIIGAQFGTVISMPLSGLLANSGIAGGWPSIFYVFGGVGAIWCVAFLIWVHEDPESHPKIAEDEKKYILSALWGTAASSVSLFFIFKHKFYINFKFFFFFFCNFSCFVFLVTASSMEINTNIITILGYFNCSYGSKLWI